MKAAAVCLAVGLGVAPCCPAGTAAAAEPLGCDAFMRDYPAAAPGYRVSFERPITINRGFGDLLSGVDVHILQSGTEVDGTLKCRGDTFLRFEARVTLPAKDKALADFVGLGQAALMTAFHWERAKAQTVEKAMSQDAAEYLRASLQRGDTYVSGKVEYHQADRLDLGLIWTDTDRTLVIASQTEE